METQQETKDYEKKYKELLDENFDLRARIATLEKLIKAQSEYISKIK